MGGFATSCPQTLEGLLTWLRERVRWFHASRKDPNFLFGPSYSLCAAHYADVAAALGLPPDSDWGQLRVPLAEAVIENTDRWLMQHEVPGRPKLPYRLSDRRAAGEILSELLTFVGGLAAEKESTPVSRKNTPGDVEAIAALGDENSLRAWEIARDETQSVDQKMRSLVRIDRRLLGWTSTRWGNLLQVSPPAIRKTDSWKELQKAKK